MPDSRAAQQPTVRVLATNDLVGSFFRQRTSYGWLPGVARLSEVAADLRAQAPASVWVDAGDLVQGCPLNVLSDGTWGWQAVDQLHIDVAALGNHELDWGLEHLRRWRGALPFDLLAANLEIGLPGSKLIEISDFALGVVGLTEPRLGMLHPGFSTVGDVVELVAEHAHDLRRAGAWRVVLAVHDGVDETVAGAPDSRRMRALCSELRGIVDLVVGGHTLMRHVGDLCGVPFLQPWAFGSEIAWADFALDGTVALGACDVNGVSAAPARGQRIFDGLRLETLGCLRAPLTASVQGSLSLPLAIAEGVIACGECDTALVAPWDLWTQPPRDGISAFLAAGPVSRADLLRVSPLCGRRSVWGGQLLAADWKPDHLEAACQRLAMTFGYGAVPADGHVGLPACNRSRATQTIRVAALPFYSPILDEIAGRAHQWREVASTWRHGLETFFVRFAPPRRTASE